MKLYYYTEKAITVCFKRKR